MLLYHIWNLKVSNKNEYQLTGLLSVAISEGKALDALLRDVLQAGHGAGARARERAVQLVCPAGWQHTHIGYTYTLRAPPDAGTSYQLPCPSYGANYLVQALSTNKKSCEAP